MDRDKGTKLILQKEENEAADLHHRHETNSQLNEGLEKLHQQMTALQEHLQGQENSATAPSLERNSLFGQDSIETQILEAIDELSHHFGKATTPEIAATINLSRWQVWRYLRQMTTAGIIHQIGKRGGWRRT